MSDVGDEGEDVRYVIWDMGYGMSDVRCWEEKIRSTNPPPAEEIRNNIKIQKQEIQNH